MCIGRKRAGCAWFPDNQISPSFDMSKGLSVVSGRRVSVTCTMKMELTDTGALILGYSLGFASNGHQSSYLPILWAKLIRNGRIEALVSVRILNR
ncbi:hypothetical protein J2X61_000717 [Bacillus sp. 3255]|nr:hypothetical protein [Bacillus sp. 3255]